MSRPQAFNQYIRTHMQPLYAEILERSDFGHDVAKITSLEVDPKIHKTLRSISALEKVYL